MQLRLTTALLGLSLLVPSVAFSADNNYVHECRYVVKDGKLDETFKGDVPKCLGAQSSFIKKLLASVEVAWKISGNPFEFVRLAPLSEFRGNGRIGVRATSVYWALERVVRPDSNCDRGDCFKDLRARFADPIALAGFYEANSGFIVAAVKAAAIIGSAGDFFNENAVLLDKPFDVALAASSGRWYGNHCWKAEADQSDAAVCKELAWFADKFKQSYGVELNPNRAWTLGFLYRRYSEGGQKLILEYQRIGKTLVAALGAATQ